MQLFSTTLGAVILTIYIANIEAAPNHECFWKFQHRRLSGAELVQISRGLTTEECRDQCLALGPEACQAFTLNHATGFCKLYQQTKASSGVRLKRSPHQDYFEIDSVCSDDDLQRILQRTKHVRRARQVNLKQPPGPPSSDSDEDVFPHSPDSTEVPDINPERPEKPARPDSGYRKSQEVHKNKPEAWDEWAPWTGCSVSCGHEGIQYRLFKCSNCMKRANRTRTCYNGPCPSGRHRRAAAAENTNSNTNSLVQWDAWGKWSACSASCGGGKQQTVRRCKGYGCQGDAKKEQDCNAQPCCTNWAAWGACSVTCGKGSHDRSRRCSAGGANAYASKEEKETQDCTGATPVCCQWTPWSDWEQCTVTCGGGNTQRTRSNNLYGGNCEGEPKESKQCSEQPCAEWESWARWTICSASCAGGSRSRTRACTVPGECPGDKEESDECNKTPCPEWSDWAPWGECSASCAGGFQKRTRVCNQYNLCPGDSIEKRDCNTHICPTWGPWGEWPECSVPCGGGEHEQSRDCQTDETYCDAGKQGSDPSCRCEGENANPKACNAHKCAEWGQWAEWGDCSADCGGGIKNRKRVCENDASFCASNPNDASCLCEGNDAEEAACGEIKCAEWGEWKEWGECSESCGGGARERKRECENDATFCVGAKLTEDACTCPGLDHSNEQCNAHKCPGWKPWGPWGECSQNCGGGERKKTRECNVDATFCGSAPATDASCVCLPETIEGEQIDDEIFEVCNDFTCAEWGEWGDWGQCSTTCGSGSQDRNRVCETDSSFCGSNPADPSCQCEGDDLETKDCNDGECPTWGEWEAWGSCSVTCGDGTATRTRVCSRDDAPCEGDQGDTDTKDCNDGECPTWGEWEAWGSCSVTCGDGTATRTRVCSRDDADCEGDQGDTDTQDCNEGECPIWGEWETWGECSVTCSSGTETRNRYCSRDDAACEGDDKGDTDVRDCDKGTCPQWTSWETWTECTVLCGGGSRTRVRTCPIVDGCAGLNEESSICNQIVCPDWGEWGNWADCSVSCGGGSRSHTRTCPIKKACTPGEPFEMDADACNTKTCPEWADWAAWSDCSVTCDLGQRVRNRVCDNGPGCLGRSEDILECTLVPCSLDTNWSGWSPCTQSCGAGGTQIRSKTQCPEGPPACGIDEETQDCNEDVQCPQWTDWEAWTDCSRSCGKGQRDRKRKCPVLNGCIGQAREIDGKPCNDIPC